MKMKWLALNLAIALAALLGCQGKPEHQVTNIEIAKAWVEGKLTRIECRRIKDVLICIERGKLSKG